MLKRVQIGLAAAVVLSVVGITALIGQANQARSASNPQATATDEPFNQVGFDASQQQDGALLDAGPSLIRCAVAPSPATPATTCTTIPATIADIKSMDTDPNVYLRIVKGGLTAANSSQPMLPANAMVCDSSLSCELASAAPPLVPATATRSTPTSIAVYEHLQVTMNQDGGPDITFPASESVPLRVG